MSDSKHPVFTPRNEISGERLRIPSNDKVMEFSRSLDDNWRELDLGVAGKIVVQRAECGLGCRCDAIYKIVG